MLTFLFRLVSFYIGILFIVSSYTILPNPEYGIHNYIPFFMGILVIVIGMFFPQINKKNIKDTETRFFIKLIITFLNIFLILFLSLIIITQSNLFKNPQKNHDAIVILGAGLSGKKPSTTLSYRLDKGIEYFNDNPDSLIVVSGGQGSDEIISEAESMKQYLIEKNISTNKILKEDKSSSTKENFLFSKTLLDDYFENKNYTILFITNDFHILRSSFYAKDAGFVGEGLSSKSLMPTFLSNYIREFFAVIWYFVQKIFNKQF